MKMKSIRFPAPVADDMVRATLEGRKTVSRRVVKEPYYIDGEEASRVSGLAIHRGITITDGMPYPDSLYHHRDILYVRETWNDNINYEIYPWETEKYIYKADGRNFEQLAPEWFYGWRPSIHMPKEAARLFLRVTGVTAKHVQDITDEDARKEGCTNREDFHRVWNDCYAKPRPIKDECGVVTHYESYPWEDIRETSTYRGKPWRVIGNPWVWVIAFERISREEAVKDES